MKPITVLDFGADSVIALVAEKQTNQPFRILGGGEAKPGGMEDGVISNMGDVVESITEALHKAESAARFKIEKVYFNFDEPCVQSVLAWGSRALKGEGEIRDSDIQVAGQTAKRLIENFEKHIVYAKELHFLIDDRDKVLNPRGVFGRKLDVLMHILQARAGLCQDWKRAFERCFVEGVLVLSSVSTAYGILPREDRQRKRLIVDLGRDFTNIFIYENNGIQDYRVFLTKESSEIHENRLDIICRQILETKKDVEQILITGDLAEQEKILHRFANFSIPCNIAEPFGQEKLNRPRYSSLVGLLTAADEIENKTVRLYPKKGLFRQTKDQASTFIKEYF